jgi:cytoskeletal protein CcmA (bactofilin family)
MKAVTTASSGIFMSSSYDSNYKFYVGGTFSGTLTSDLGATGISYATSGTISGATAK